MWMRLRWVGVGLTVWGATFAVRADEPATLPPPRPLPQVEVQPPPMPEAYPPPVAVPVYPVRRNPYEVWQYYGVSHQGFFRPRVIYAPYGQYYLYNGQPYPWAPVHGLEFMTYITD